MAKKDDKEDNLLDDLQDEPEEEVTEEDIAFLEEMRDLIKEFR